MVKITRLLLLPAAMLTALACGGGGGGGSAALSVEVSSLDFGTVWTEITSPTLTVTVHNTGTAAAPGFTAAEPSDPQFAVADDCAGGVPAGGVCHLRFTFTPAQSGAASADSSTVTPAGTLEVTLQGTGRARTVSASALVLDFGPVAVGATSAALTSTLTNNGSTLLDGFAGGGVGAPFSGSQSCAAGVAPGASCTYSFTFHPTEAGSFSVTSTSSTSGGPVIVEVRGTGVGAAATVTPLSLDFGWVAVGGNAQRTVTITNTGMATLQGFAGGGVSAPFAVSQDCAGGVLPGASCHYTVSFHPTGAGEVSATSSTSSNGGSFAIALKGVGGAAPAGAQQVVSPQVLDFGPVGVGQTSAQQAATISNAGTVALGSFTGGGVPAPFSATQDCAVGVAVGGSCKYYFRFAPIEAGAATATSSSTDNAGVIRVEVRGTGVAPAATVSPLDLDFGSVPVGTTKDLQVVFTNTGLSPLGSFVGGGVSAPFQGTQDCAVGVPVGATCHFVYRFAPAATGRFITVSSGSSNAGPFSIRLRGTGVAP